MHTHNTRYQAYKTGAWDQTYYHRDEIVIEFWRIFLDVVGYAIHGNAGGELSAKEQEGYETCENDNIRVSSV